MNFILFCSKYFDISENNLAFCLRHRPIIWKQSDPLEYYFEEFLGGTSAVSTKWLSYCSSLLKQTPVGYSTQYSLNYKFSSVANKNSHYYPI